MQLSGAPQGALFFFLRPISRSKTPAGQVRLRSRQRLQSFGVGAAWGHRRRRRVERQSGPRRIQPSWNRRKPERRRPARHRIQGKESPNEFPYPACPSRTANRVNETLRQGGKWLSKIAVRKLLGVATIEQKARRLPSLPAGP